MLNERFDMGRHRIERVMGIGKFVNNKQNCHFRQKMVITDFAITS